jgi:aspartate aminotransferase
LERLRELVLRHDLFLFADEVYREFVYDGRDYLSTLSLEGLDAHLILVDSVSKRFSMCGVRIGAMVTRNREVYQTVMKFAQARLSPPTLGQVASEAAMDVPEAYFEEVIREYVHRRDVMHGLLLEIPGVVAPKPGGAFYLVAALPVEDAEDFCAWMLSEFSYENQTVMMAPAAGFYSTPGLGKNQVRIAYVLEEDALRKAMLCLREGLQAYAKLKSKAKAALNG